MNEALRILGADEIRQVASIAPITHEPPPFEPRPIPANARAPNLRDFDHVYTYRNTAGAVLRYICRIDGPPKRIVPLTWGSLGGRIGWHMRHATYRGLYGLDQIAARIDATVIVTEGEKAADAAALLFPSRVSVTWSGGAQAVGKTDWGPLARRRVILWPDNDAPGIAAMEQISALLIKINALIAMVHVADLRPGDDAADVMPSNPETWLQERLRVIK